MLNSITLALALTGSASAGLVQKPFLQVPAAYKGQANVVRQMFNTSYQSYKKYAWSHDDLSPISLSYNDPRNGWGASIADSMSTMYIMGGFDKEFIEAVNYFSKVDFNRSYTSDTVSIFETTIRYVGGFLSAYELSGYKYPILVQKAKQITDKLAHGFNGASAIPYGFVDFSTNQPTLSSSNIAEAGTLALEWGTLSSYTFNTTYRKLTEGALKHIATLPAPYPGLAAQGINPSDGTFNGQYVTWGGGSDSYFEYLIKYARLTNTNDPIYVNTWKTAVDSSLKYLLSHSSVGNWTYIADSPTPGQLRLIGSHLECFIGGNWIQGGKLINNQTIVNYGLQLVDSCWNTYASTATGIGPEVFAWVAGNDSTQPTGDDATFYKAHGFYVNSGYSYYDLRPEVLESNFYAWRATGNTKYLDRAKSAIASFQKYIAINGAYAGIDNVNDASDTSKFDNMESFWFAEVLKYLYLTFDDPAHISLDEWVFNTEAHPLRAPPPKFSYATAGEAVPAASIAHGVVHGPSAPVISPIPKLPAGLLQLSALYN